MLLAVDVGNTKIKAAVFEGSELVAKYNFEADDLDKTFKEIFTRHANIASAILSSVGNSNEVLLEVLSEYTDVIVISHSSHFPFLNNYSTPHTLGIDRMVLAAGAVLQFPHRHRLVIDAGTCVTYDFITDGDYYLGGAISPGLRLRYESLHNFTAKLPLLSPELPLHYTGNSTSQSIHSGVVNGLLNEIEGFISQYSEQYQELIIILTGGDADFLAKRLKNTIFANSNFLLESLNFLYTYTIKK